MTESIISVEIDEGISNHGPYLLALILKGSQAIGRIFFRRNANPKEISARMKETGYLLKLDEFYQNLPPQEGDCLGDAYIEAAFKVPDLS